MDQLREVFDGVNVVVRRRRNETDPGRGETRLRDPGIHFPARQFATFTRLGALRHLDLEFLGFDEVLAGDAEASGSDLFDGGILRVSLFVGPGIALGIFAAFSGVVLSSLAVYRTS